MKSFFTVLLGILTIGVLIFGHTYWSERTAATPNEKTLTNTETSNPPIQSENTELLKYTKSWPQDASEHFKQAMAEKRPYKILFVGSPAMGSETEGAFPIVKSKLLETYGESNLNVSLKTFNFTSAQLLSSHGQDEISNEKADLVVLEPFILLNNGNVLIKDTLKNTTQIMDEIKVKNPETTFILQPSYPLYKAKIYPGQVEELKNFAMANQIPYLDHWSAWPDPKTKDFKEYILADQSAPSDKGNQVWSDFLIYYFINQD